MIKEIFAFTWIKALLVLGLFAISFLAMLLTVVFYGCFALIGSCPPTPITDAVIGIMTFPGGPISTYFFRELLNWKGPLPSELSSASLLVYFISQWIFYHIIISIFSPYLKNDLKRDSAKIS